MKTNNGHEFGLKHNLNTQTSACVKMCHNKMFAKSTKTDLFLISQKNKTQDLYPQHRKLN